MVTHDPFAASFCSRVIFIRDGEIAMEIAREGTRKAFFDMILKSLVQMGGGENDLY
jgi:putative ABC transport system ATP-binding protein